ncbi:hypothetical protein WA577_002640, partial [Blastocystis sp. JDR]
MEEEYPIAETASNAAVSSAAMDVEQTHFRDKVESYVDESIDTIAFHMSAEKVENEAVSDIFNSILAEFKSKCRDLLSRAAIPDSNEDLLNSQHHTETEAIYLEKKKNNLEAIYTGYAEEERAWEENLSFFSNPASIQCVEMTDCIFENINDTATLSNINDRCANLLSLLHSVKDIKDEATEARNSLVTVYQQEVLRRWNALGKSVNPRD